MWRRKSAPSTTRPGGPGESSTTSLPSSWENADRDRVPQLFPCPQDEQEAGIVYSMLICKGSRKNVFFLKAVQLRREGWGETSRQWRKNNFFSDSHWTQVNGLNGTAIEKKLFFAASLRKPQLDFFPSNRSIWNLRLILLQNHNYCRQYQRH